MKEEEDEPSNWENYHDKDQVYHHNIWYFVSKINTKEVLTLSEEVESEKLNVSLIDDEQKNSIEGVFPDVLWDSVVEEELKYEVKSHIDYKWHRKLKEEEVEVVGEES